MIKRFSKLWTIAILILGMIIACEVWGETNTNFSYVVQVEARNTGKAIPNAKVTIHVADKVLTSFTDSDGLARVSVVSAYEGEIGRLIVKTTGYQEYTRFIDLVEDSLPLIVQLEPAFSNGYPN